MKVLFLGEIGPGQTSRMRMHAFERLGHVVHGVDTMKRWKRASWFNRQVQRRLQYGLIINQINNSVIKAAREFRPNLVWAEKQEFLRVETIEELQKLKAKVMHFTPDPYFYIKWKRTRIMDLTIGAFDALIYCKSYERREYEALGKPLAYMPLGYCDKVHRALKSDDPRWLSAVGFLGGWEPRRERWLSFLAKTGVDLKIWGAYWEFLCDGRWTPRRQIILRQLAGNERFHFHHDELLARAYQGSEIYADDYARALTGAKIGLGFLRRTWPDQHTTRTFEIPACGSMLLADRTEEHQELFEEGREAEYFSSDEELQNKVMFYSCNETARERIAQAGYKRCVKSKYSYVHRIRTALETISRF
jgi:spore maturation protein CgeB